MIHKKLTLLADGLILLTTWFDASYAVYENMKGYTGSYMSLGSGIIHYKSSNQKINAISSPECEFSGARDYLPFTIYTKYFIEAQGYKVRNNTFNQDNQAPMKLEKMAVPLVARKHVT